MASPSPSPVQVAGSPLDSYRVDSPRHFSSSPQDLSNSVTTTTSTTRTSLVSSYSSNGQRSYGTVKQFSSSLRRSSSSVVIYHPVEGDTLQGIALKFNASIQDIERLNNIWNTDSMFCKPSIKIPISYHSNNSSHTPSPSASPGMQRHNHSSSPGVHSSSDLSQQLSNGSAHSSLNPAQSQGPLNPLDPGDGVRSKVRPRQRRSESVTAECREDGVKNIMDILNCADVQLEASKEFAERLAKKSSILASAKDSYHGTRNGDTHRLSPAPSSIPVPPQDREQSPRLKRRLQLKRVETTPEKIQENRDKLEENLFEL